MLNNDILQASYLQDGLCSVREDQGPLKANAAAFLEENSKAVELMWDAQAHREGRRCSLKLV